jgi:hypothetical protein
MILVHENIILKSDLICLEEGGTTNNKMLCFYVFMLSHLQKNAPPWHLKAMENNRSKQMTWRDSSNGRRRLCWWQLCVVAGWRGSVEISKNVRSGKRRCLGRWRPSRVDDVCTYDTSPTRWQEWPTTRGGGKLPSLLVSRVYYHYFIHRVEDNILWLSGYA